MQNESALTDENLAKCFSKACDAVGQSLETLRHDYYVMAQMLEDGRNTIGGLTINQSGRLDYIEQKRIKEKEFSRDRMYLLLLNDIKKLESVLEQKYGEDFAENLAAQYLDEETYTNIMAIEDQDERRRQIALALQQGIEDGTIDPSAFEDDPLLIQWIEARAAAEQNIVAKAGAKAQEPEQPSDKENETKAYELGSGSNEASTFDNIF